MGEGLKGAAAATGPVAPGNSNGTVARCGATGMPSNDHDSRCSCSSNFSRFCCVFSWPSRNWR